LAAEIVREQTRRARRGERAIKFAQFRHTARVTTATDRYSAQYAPPFPSHVRRLAPRLTTLSEAAWWNDTRSMTRQSDPPAGRDAHAGVQSAHGLPCSTPLAFSPSLRYPRPAPLFPNPFPPSEVARAGHPQDPREVLLARRAAPRLRLLTVK
jgi:hypothetical protein